MKLPALGDLLPEQFKVYDHDPDQSLFIAGPPGSGKTTLAVLRAQYLVNLGKNVILVTRNRMLTALASQLGAGSFEAKTMSTLITKDHSQRLRYYAPQFSPFVYKWDEIISAYQMQRLTPIAEHLVIDEGQNLPPGFFRWAALYGATTLTVFADEDQSTDAHRSTLQDICEQANLDDPFRLTFNHRNTPEIAAVAEHFHHSMILPPGIVKRPPGGSTPRMISVATLEEVVRPVVTRFRNQGDSIGVIVRTMSEARYLHQRIKAELPTARVDVYTSDRNSGEEMGIRSLDPGITVLTGESVIGLEFNAVYLLDLKRSLPCVSDSDRRRMYMLCARARDSLVLVDGPPSLTPVQRDALPSPPILVR